ncbi:MAG: type II toxin-antitoxin system RelE/ParE family toxin [Gammaproteobacteria bacterium]|nr:type II toxin-antitoxin system RelE/ParE family toxin [Gammaproteobacteria bacterium]
MIYKLKFLPIAKIEWDKLTPSVKVIFKKKLIKRLENPIVPKDKLKGDLKDCYKIKLLKLGYRLVYKVDKKEIVVLVLCVGKRENFIVYKNKSTLQRIQ